MLPNLSLILGGAASGKSAYAEKLIAASAAPKVYLATAQAFDDEMKGKIAAHRAQRGDGWTTIEEPLDVVPAPPALLLCRMKLAKALYRTTRFRAGSAMRKDG